MTNNHTKLYEEITQCYLDIMHSGSPNITGEDRLNAAKNLEASHLYETIAFYRGVMASSTRGAYRLMAADRLVTLARLVSGD